MNEILVEEEGIRDNWLENRQPDKILQNEFLRPNCKRSKEWY